jgi:hypothetical protein
MAKDKPKKPKEPTIGRKYKGRGVYKGNGLYVKK